MTNQLEVRVRYATLIEVDNSREDPKAGRAGLRDELAPALRSMPGFVSALLLTAYERGRGVAVVVFETRDQAQRPIGAIGEGHEIRAGVVVTDTDILEVTAAA